MARPSDWWVLDLDRDPTPGAPDRLDLLGNRFLDFADVAHRAYRSVQSLQGDGAVLTWIGLSGDAFREQFGEFPEQLRKLYASHEMAGDALHDYAPKLTAAQAQADRALADGRAARDQLNSVNGQLAIAEGDFTTISRQADELRNPPPETNGPDPDQVRQALRDAEAAEQRLTTVRGQAASAEQALQAAKTLADQARQLRDTAARECEQKIHEASDVGIQPRSFWQKLGDAFKAIWDVICEIAKWVALVAGVIALIIGGPLAWVALAAGAVLLVKAIVDFSQGKGNVLDLVFGILGIIPGVRGLTSLSRLQSLYKAGGLKEIGKAALSSMKDFAKGLVTLVKNVGSGAVAVVKNLGEAIPKIGNFGRGGDNSQEIVNFTRYSENSVEGAIDSAQIISKPITGSVPYVTARGRDSIKNMTIGVSFPSKGGDYSRHVQWGKNTDFSVGQVVGGNTVKVVPPWGDGVRPVFAIFHSSPSAAGVRIPVKGADGNFMDVAVDGSAFAHILADSKAFQQAFQAARAMNPDAPVVLLGCKFAFEEGNTVANSFASTLRGIEGFEDTRIFASNQTVDIGSDGSTVVKDQGEFVEL